MFTTKCSVYIPVLGYLFRLYIHVSTSSRISVQRLFYGSLVLQFILVLPNSSVKRADSRVRFFVFSSLFCHLFCNLGQVLRLWFANQYAFRNVLARRASCYDFCVSFLGCCVVLRAMNFGYQPSLLLAVTWSVLLRTIPIRITRCRYQRYLAKDLHDLRRVYRSL